MAPNTRRTSIFVKKIDNSTIEDFNEELKQKINNTQAKKTRIPENNKKKLKPTKIPQVQLKKAADRILNPIPLNRIDPNGRLLREVQLAAQLLKVTPYRVEKGVIIID